MPRLEFAISLLIIACHRPGAAIEPSTPPPPLTSASIITTTPGMVTSDRTPSIPIWTSTLPSRYHQDKIPRSTFSTQEQYKEFLEACPSFRQKMKETCEQETYSCKTRCGLDPPYYACSCDGACSVYKNCCWDFQAQCPHVASHFVRHYYHQGSRLGNAHIECVANNPVIDSCGGVDSEGNNRTYEQRDARVPIVSVDKDLTFRNKTVYEQCLGEWNKGHNNITSLDLFVGLMKGASITSLHNFFYYGTLDDNLYVRPYHLIIRRCLEVFNIRCSELPENDNCRSVPTVSLQGSNQLCSQVTDSEVQSDERFDTSPFQPSKKQRSSTCRVLRLNTVAISSILQTKLQLVTRVSFNEGVNRPVFNIEDMSSSYNTLNRHLKRYSCEKGNDDDDDNDVPCKIIAECEPGFIPVHLICRRPTIFIAQFVGIDRDDGSAIQEKIVLSLFELIERRFRIFKAFDEKQLRNNMDVFQREDGYRAVVDFLPIKNEVEFDYNGIRLPVTDFIIGQLENMLESLIPARNRFRKLTLCFVLGKELLYNGSLLCDRALLSGKNGSWVVDGHSMIPGTRLPDPFLEVLAVSGASWSRWSHRLWDFLTLSLPGSMLTPPILGIIHDRLFKFSPRDWSL